MKNLSIILPTYNEEEALGGLLDEINTVFKETGIDYEILVIDDGSSDRTAETAGGREKVRVISHPYNMGAGTAGRQHKLHRLASGLC